MYYAIPKGVIAKRGRGRPRMTPAERRRLIVKLRLRISEKMFVREAASIAKMPITEWMRTRLLSAAQAEIASAPPAPPATRKRGEESA